MPCKTSTLQNTKAYNRRVIRVICRCARLRRRSADQNSDSIQTWGAALQHDYKVRFHVFISHRFTRQRRELTQCKLMLGGRRSPSEMIRSRGNGNTEAKKTDGNQVTKSGRWNNVSCRGPDEESSAAEDQKVDESQEGGGIQRIQIILLLTSSPGVDAGRKRNSTHRLDLAGAFLFFYEKLKFKNSNFFSRECQETRPI